MEKGLYLAAKKGLDAHAKENKLSMSAAFTCVRIVHVKVVNLILVPLFCFTFAFMLTLLVSLEELQSQHKVDITYVSIA